MHGVFLASHYRRIHGIDVQVVHRRRDFANAEALNPAPVVGRPRQAQPLIIAVQEDTGLHKPMTECGERLTRESGLKRPQVFGQEEAYPALYRFHEDFYVPPAIGVPNLRRGIWKRHVQLWQPKAFTQFCKALSPPVHGIEAYNPVSGAGTIDYDRRGLKTSQLDLRIPEWDLTKCVHTAKVKPGVMREETQGGLLPVDRAHEVPNPRYAVKAAPLGFQPLTLFLLSQVRGIAEIQVQAADLFSTRKGIGALFRLAVIE